MSQLFYNRGDAYMRNLIVASTLAAAYAAAGGHASAYADSACYDHVVVTGYYVPLLSDYHVAKSKKILVDGERRAYNASFLSFAKIKRAGVSLAGDILVYGHDRWSIRSEPLTPEEKTWFPFEKDYVTTRTIATREDGAVSRTYPKAFVDEAGLQGSGKIREGEYIGWPDDCPVTDGLIAYLSPQCDAKWHVHGDALDASGKPAALGVVATDKKYFDPAHPWTVTIDPMPIGFAETIFIARDLGPAITDKHIDVFSGWGFKGLARAMSLTSNAATVCFSRTAQN